MGCEKPCIFMTVNIGRLYSICLVCLCKCVCVFQSPTNSSHHAELSCVSCQKLQVLSAVRRSGDGRLGDHYKGHKRAIYRTASEWSQHGLRWKARNVESGASGECDDLNMKVRDVAALVASALWSVNHRPREGPRCHLIFHVRLEFAL